MSTHKRNSNIPQTLSAQRPSLISSKGVLSKLQNILYRELLLAADLLHHRNMHCTHAAPHKMARSYTITPTAAGNKA
jgi:hypothetical protein